MSTRIETLQVDANVGDLLPIFDKGFVAIVLDRTKFLGLITRYDLLTYLRRRAQ